MRYIRWFDEIRATDVDLVGGKGANLGEMAVSGFPVPPGFCLAAQSYRDFIHQAGLEAPIRALLAQTEMDHPVDVEAQTAQIRSLIRGHEVPETIAEQIEASYRSLAEKMGRPKGDEVAVAVRSSATAEDLPQASFAGQQDSYLNVVGVGDLLEKVKDCWASLWTARAVTYRTRKGFDHQAVSLAVVVQVMVPSRVAGVLFTANPVSGIEDESVLNASWGLGEAVVSGAVTPDTFIVSKPDGHILSQEIGTKEITIAYERAGGTQRLDTPLERRQIPSLSKDEVSELVGIGQAIEDHYGSPQDIEWAYADDRCFVLQARPITTRAEPKETSTVTDEFNRTMFVEIFPDPLSPMFLSAICPLLKEMLDFTLKTWGFTPSKQVQAIGEFYNQPYFNRAYLAKALEGLSPLVQARLVSQLVNPFGRHEEVMRGELSLPYIGLMVRMLRFLVRFPPQLPEIIKRYRNEIKQIDSLPLAEATDREIVDRIRMLVFDSASRFLNYDFLMIAEIGITYQILGTLLERYCEEDTQLLRAKLISGVTGNVTMETNIHLWDLAQLVKSSSKLSEITMASEAHEIRAQLERVEEGREFLDALDAFLEEYGHREIRMDILYPTWGEDPTPVYNFIRGYLDADEEQSPHRQQARLVDERQTETANVLNRVEQTWSGRFLVAPFFRWILGQTQMHTRERDTMHFELTRLFPTFRKMLFELGHRWCSQGFLSRPEDVFFLEFDELVHLSVDPRSMAEAVESRRATFELNKERPWPDIVRSDQEVFAETESTGEISEGIRGVAGSPGVATGRATVIRGPEEFGKLGRGDILVAPLTNPVWTPLFAIAGGIVTEVGGILSHGAIVAREYGIPAVLSVAGATSVIPDGAGLTVDGNQGIVSLEDSV